MRRGGLCEALWWGLARRRAYTFSHHLLRPHFRMPCHVLICSLLESQMLQCQQNLQQQQRGLTEVHCWSKLLGRTYLRRAWFKCPPEQKRSVSSGKSHVFIQDSFWRSSRRP